VLDLPLPRRFDASVFMAERNADGGYRGRQIIDAIDITHPTSDLPVAAFYTAGNTAGRFNVYIAGRGGVAATGTLNNLFDQCTNATSIDVSLLDTSDVTSMGAVFASMRALTTLDLSGWDTSNVTSIDHMFFGTSALTRIDGLSGFDTSNVTDMASVFRNASALTSLDLSSFDTSNVTTMRGMFHNTNNLTTVDFRSATFGSVTENYDMFTNSGGINTMIVGSTAAQTFIQNAPGWNRTPARTITIAS